MRLWHTNHLHRWRPSSVHRAERRGPPRPSPWLLTVLAALGFGVGCGQPSVLVVGLDGANWAILDPLIDAGYLPTIGALVHDGARAEMDCVASDPVLPCFCPPSWTSIATGRPLADHHIYNFEMPSSNRRVNAIWNVARDHGALVILNSWRGTWPPEPFIDYVFTEPGNDWVAEQMYETWASISHTGRDQPETLFQPEHLAEQLGLVPHEGERPPSWAIHARDRAAMSGMLDLAVRLRELEESVPRAELAMVLLHGPDKVEHVIWGSIQSAMWEPIDALPLLAGAAEWDGPFFGSEPYGWGSLAAPFLEADAWLGQLLSARPYDYVVFVSDHGMTRSPSGLTGNHGEPHTEAHDGIFAVSGPGIAEGVWLPPITVLDVAPTLAYLLGIPVATDLPGRVIAEAFTQQHLDLLPLRSTPSWE